MKYVIVAFLIFLTYVFTKDHFDDRYQAGYEAGMKEALKVNPPSDELELVCVGLWIGEQNRKYYEKENRSAR